MTTQIAGSLHRESVEGAGAAGLAAWAPGAGYAAPRPSSIRIASADAPEVTCADRRSGAI